MTDTTATIIGEQSGSTSINHDSSFLFDDGSQQRAINCAVISPLTYKGTAAYAESFQRNSDSYTIGTEKCGKGLSGEINTNIQKLFIFLKGIKQYGSLFTNGATNKTANLRTQISKTAKAIAGILKLIVQRVRNWILKKIKQLVRGIIEDFLTPILKQIKEAVVKLTLDQIFCVFDNIIDGLVEMVANFLFQLLGQIVNAPLCAAESWTNALINKLVSDIDRALGPIFDGINDLLGGVAKIAGSVMSAVDKILGYEGLFCAQPYCPELTDFRAGIWGGPSKTFKKEFNDFEFIPDDYPGTITDTANDWLDDFFGEDTATGSGTDISLPSGKVMTLGQSPGACYAGKFECGLPQVVIFGGGGSGAVGQAVVNNIGQVIGANILSSGSGYTSPPFVSIVDPAGCGNNASAGSIIDDDGNVGDIVIVNPGEGYNDTYIGGAPVITMFVGAPNPVVVGRYVSLSWDVSNSDKVSLNVPGFNSLPLIGSVNIPVTEDMVQFPAGGDIATKVFILTAEKSNDKSESQVTESRFILTVQKAGTVDPPPGPNTSAPIIDSFSASQSVVSPGDILNLNWETSNTTSVSLDIQGADSLPVDGSTSVVIPEDIIPTGGSDITQMYTLTATNINAIPTEQNVQQSVSVTIVKPSVIPDIVTDPGIDPGTGTGTDPGIPPITGVDDDVVTGDDGIGTGVTGPGVGTGVDTVIGPGTGTGPGTGGGTDTGNNAVSVIGGIDIINTGIGYTPGDVAVVVGGGGGPNDTDDGDGNNGANVEIELNEVGQVVGINVVSTGYGFTKIPFVAINSRTGLGAEFRPRLKFIPLDDFLEDQNLQTVDPNKLVQVVDCVSL